MVLHHRRIDSCGDIHRICHDFSELLARPDNFVRRKCSLPRKRALPTLNPFSSYGLEKLLTYFPQSARWIVLTIFETSLELLLVVPVAMIVLTLQTNLKNKLFTISAFLCRLMYASPPPAS